ncbi:hypothetical protein ACLOJK_013164 [Asimina triloba]
MEQEESQEMRISLLHSSIDDDAPPPPHTSLIAYLYAGHFLGRWGARMWEFSFGLFMIDVWPDSQLFAAIYGAVESASTALFGSIYILQGSLSMVVGPKSIIHSGWRDSNDATDLPCLEIIGFHCILVTYCFSNVSGATGVLATLAGTISIEREWVVFCIIESISDYASNLEYRLSLAVILASDGIPALSESNQMRSMTAVLDDSLSSSSDEKEATSLMPEGNNSGIEENDQKLKTAERILRLPCMDAWVVYLKQDVVLPGVALTLLYFSVLSFGTLMTASLEWKVGLSAVIQQMQDHVPETDRCVVGGVQNSLQAMLVLMTYILGMFISDPKDFGTLVMVGEIDGEIGIVTNVKFLQLRKVRHCTLEMRVGEFKNSKRSEVC